VHIYDDKRFHAIMRSVAQKLNLKEHKVMEMGSQTEKLIAGPVDIEGHRGIDGRHYILDTGKFSRRLLKS
jgi:hypothetical protein